MMPHICDLSNCPQPVLIRLTLWEEQKHAAQLQAYLADAGHPFVIRRPNEVAIDPIFGTSGVYLELFVLPLDLERLMKILQLSNVEDLLESQFEMRFLPNLFLRRRRQPADIDMPYLEFKLVLGLLPRWQLSPEISS